MKSAKFKIDEHVYIHGNFDEIPNGELAKVADKTWDNEENGYFYTLEIAGFRNQYIYENCLKAKK